MAQNLWKRCSGFLTRHRVLALLLSTALTLLSIRLAPTVVTTGDVAANLPQDDPEVAYWLEMTRRFEGLSMLMVGLEEPGDPFSSDGLSRLSRITARLAEKKAEGLLFVRSLTNVETVTPDEEGTLNAGLLIPAIPLEAEGLRALARKVASNRQVSGVLVSKDLAAYVVLVRPDPRKDAREVAELVREVVEAERGPMKAYYFGAPFVAQMITRTAYARLDYVVPLFAFLLLLVLWYRLRRMTAALLVAFATGLSLLWWLALLRLFGVEFGLSNVNTALVVLVMAAMTFARIAEARIRGEAEPFFSMLALLAVVASLLAASALDWLKPYSLPFLVGFGETSLPGVLAVVLCGVLFLGPSVTYLRVSPTLPDRPETGIRRRPAIILAIVVLAAGVFSACQLRFLVTLDELFSPSDEVGATNAFFDRHFGGNELVQIGVDGAMQDPAVVARVLRFTDYLEGSRAFADVRSVAQILAYLGSNFAGVYKIPGDRASLANLWFFLEGQEDIRSLVTQDRLHAMVVARVPAGQHDLEKVIGVVRDAVALSARTDEEAVATRLESVAGAMGVSLTREQCLEAVRRARSADSAPEETWVAKVSEYLRSPSSPFEASDEVVQRIIGAMRGPQDGLVGRLMATIAAMPEARPDMLEGVTSTLLLLKHDTVLFSRADAMTKALLGPELAANPELVARIRGVFADLLEQGPQGPGGGETAAFIISGYPALAPRIAKSLLGGLWTTALLAVVMAALVVSLFWPRRGARLALESALATILALGASGLAFQTDASSAGLFLLAPVAACLSSGACEADGQRRLYPVTFALALGIAALSLQMIGIAPISRVGATVTASLLGAALATWRPVLRP